MEMNRPEGQVLTGSAWLVASTVVVAGGSLLYWLIASHRFLDNAVGNGSTMFASVFFLNFATSCGLPTTVTRFGGGGPLGATVTRWATRWSAITSIAGVGIFVAFAPDDIMNVIGTRFAALVELSLVVVSISISVVVDAQLIALRRWSVVFWRTVAIALVRLGLLVVIPTTDQGHLLYLVAALPFGVTGVVLLPGLIRRARQPNTDSAELRHFALISWLSQSAAQAPLFVTPLVVLLFADQHRGEFYVAWGLASVGLVGVQVVGQALLAEGSRTIAMLRSHLVNAITVGLVLGAAGAALVAILAGPISRLFGLSDPELIARYLRRLVPGAVPWVLAVVAIASARVQGDTRRTLLASSTYAAAIIAGTLAGGFVAGPGGAVTGWLLGGLASMTITYPIVSRELTRTEPGELPNSTDSLAGPHAYE